MLSDRPLVDAPIPLTLGESEFTKPSAGATQLRLVGAEPVSQVRVRSMDPSGDLEQESIDQGSHRPGP